MKTMLAILLSLIAATAAMAGWPDGYVDANGFTYNAAGGYWSLNGYAYYPYRVGNGYGGYKTYYDVRRISSGDAASELERYLLGLAKDRQRHDQLMDLIDTLGLKGAYVRQTASNYGSVNPLLNAYNAGNTVYADVPQSVGIQQLAVSSYGSFDAQATIGALTRLAETAIVGGRDIAGDATGFASQVNQGVVALNDSIIRVAEAQTAANAAVTQTKAQAELLQANAASLNAAKPKDHTSIQLLQGVQVQGGAAIQGGAAVQGGPQVPPAPPQPPQQGVVDLSAKPMLNQHCAMCHVKGGQTASDKSLAGLNLSAVTIDSRDLALLAIFGGVDERQQPNDVLHMPPTDAQPTDAEKGELARELLGLR